MKLGSENKGIKDVKTLFEHQEEDYHKLLTVGNFNNNDYIEYISSGDRNKNLSLK